MIAYGLLEVGGIQRFVYEDPSLKGLRGGSYLIDIKTREELPEWLQREYENSVEIVRRGGEALLLKGDADQLPDIQ